MPLSFECIEHTSNNHINVKSSFLKLQSYTKTKEKKSKWELAAKCRMYSVVLSIGAGSMFLVSLDSVVDNLLPVAQPFLIDIYRSQEAADHAWEWIVSSRIYGLAAGCLISLLLANYPSRKVPLLWALCFNLLGGMLSGLIVYIPWQYGVLVSCFGRFLSGVGSGVAQVVGSAMLAEIPPIHSRGTVLATLTVWSCIGELSGMFISLDSVLGSPNLWHFALAAPTLLIPLALVLIVSAPDSPRSLLMAGKRQEALKSIKFYQCSEDWYLSLADIYSEVKGLREEQVRTSGHTSKKKVGRKEVLIELEKKEIRKTLPFLKEQCMMCRRQLQQLQQLMNWRLKSGAFVRPLMLAMFVLTFAHLDDWLWISYSTQVFENVGMASAEAMQSSLLMSLPQAIISIILLFCFDVFSRRLLIIVPTLASIGASSLVIAGLFQSHNLKISGLFFGVWPLKNVIVLLAAFDLSAAAVASQSAYTVVPELFSQRDRIFGSALCGITQNLFGGFLTTISLSIINMYGTQFVLLPFIFINFLYVLVIYKWLPETSGRSFHTISQQFKEELPQFFQKAGSTLRRMFDLLSQVAGPFLNLCRKSSFPTLFLCARWKKMLWSSNLLRISANSLSIAILLAQITFCAFVTYLALNILLYM